MSIKASRACSILGIVLFLQLVLQGAQGCFTDSQRQLDPASRAYLSPIVVSGHLLRKSPVFANKFTATFRVARVYKSKGLRLRKRSEIVLQFWSIRRIPRTQNCCVAAKALIVGKKYFIFAESRTWDRSFKSDNSSSSGKALVMSAYNEPVRATNRHRRAIKGILCRRCAKPPTVTGLKDTSVKTSARLRLKCKIKGNPPPIVAWFKDGSQLLPSKRIRIRNKRKSSRLTVRHAKLSDSGRYECHARNVVSKWPAVHIAKITVIDSRTTTSTTTTTPSVRPTNDSTLWKFVGKPCPLLSFCLNGGTCSLYEEVGEFVCQCAEGYKGPRCENKDLSERTITRDSSGFDATTRMLQLYWG